MERLLLIHPDDMNEVRDRGLLLYRLQRFSPALDALNAYLAARPHAPDQDNIAQHVISLRQLLASLN